MVRRLKQCGDKDTPLFVCSANNFLVKKYTVVWISSVLLNSNKLHCFHINLCLTLGVCATLDLIVKPCFYSFFPGVYLFGQKNITPLHVSFALLQSGVMLHTMNELIKNWMFFLWCENFILITTKSVIWEFCIPYATEWYWNYSDESPFN